MTDTKSKTNKLAQQAQDFEDYEEAFAIGSGSSAKSTEDDDLDFEASDFSSEELEEIKETVIQQLVVSYNLYKSIKEMYDNKETEMKVIEKLQNVLSDITKISDEVNKVTEKETKDIKTYTYISIGIGALNLLLLALILFLK